MLFKKSKNNYKSEKHLVLHDCREIGLFPQSGKKGVFMQTPVGALPSASFPEPSRTSSANPTGSQKTPQQLQKDALEFLGHTVGLLGQMKDKIQKLQQSGKSPTTDDLLRLQMHVGEMNKITDIFSTVLTRRNPDMTPK